MKVLSICTAAYNAESYICQMIESIMLSPLSDYTELLVVNDGSTDNTKSILAEYEKKYNGILRVLHQENGGSGAARNRAFRFATGKYIKIIDADDYVDTDRLTDFIRFLQNTDADMILNGFYISQNDRIELKTLKGLNEQLYKCENITIEPFLLSMHGVTYKTSIISQNNIRLSEGLSYVDKEYVTLPLPYVQTIQYVDIPFYVYRLGIAGQSVDPRVSMEKNEMRQKIGFRLLNEYDLHKSEICNFIGELIEYNIALLFKDYFDIYCRRCKMRFFFIFVKNDIKVKKKNSQIYDYLGQTVNNLDYMRSKFYLGYFSLWVRKKTRR